MSFRIIREAVKKNAYWRLNVTEDCKTTFMDLKLKKAYSYVVFKIDETKNEIIVEKTGDPSESYDDFVVSLPDDDCRFAVYDFDFVTEENCQKSKMFFIAWAPDISRIRAKMLYAMCKNSFKGELDGVHCEIQATDHTEMDLDVIRDRVR